MTNYRPAARVPQDLTGHPSANRRAVGGGGPGNEGGYRATPMPARHRPNACTYWVVEGRLLAGEYPTGSAVDVDSRRGRLQGYLEAGITHFVDLTEPGEKPPYESLLRDIARQSGIEHAVSYQRIPVEDFDIPSQDTMKRVLDAIDGHLIGSDDRSGGGVYVHCRGGIGRTGTAVGCYLVRRLGCSGEQALREVNRLFRSSDRRYDSPRSPETSEQERFVREWSEPSFGTIIASPSF